MFLPLLGLLIAHRLTIRCSGGISPVENVEVLAGRDGLEKVGDVEVR